MKTLGNYLGESKMNRHLFDRKNFLEHNWMTPNMSEYFSFDKKNENMIVKVNLLRATSTEADSMKKYLFRVNTENNHPIIIDLSSCNFVDSTFLSSIISFNKSSDIKIKLVVADKRQLTIFKITKLDSLFNIYDNLNSALVS
jgi:anti-anti-sigma regulatory factor